jgi:hypothetical protein
MIDRDKMRATGFPRVTKRLNLSDFVDYMREQGVDEESAAAVEVALEGNYLNVWLNHDQAFRDDWLDYNVAVEEGEKIKAELRAEGAKKEPDQAKITMLVDQLNDSAEVTLSLGRSIEAQLLSCEVEDINAIHDISPELYRWVCRRAWEMVTEYRAGRKKADTR